MPIALTGMVLGLSAVHSYPQAKAQTFTQIESPQELVDEVWQIVDKSYVDPTFNNQDWQAVRQDFLSRSYPSDQAVYEALKEMMGLLGDPFSRFMNPTEFRNLQVDSSGERTGIGLQLSQEQDTQEIVVVSPIDGSAAFEAGIFPGDILLSIDSISTADMSLDDAVARLQGAIGSEVEVSIQREQVQQTFQIRRVPFEVRPVQSRIQETDAGNIGYIRLTQFSASASSNMRTAMTDTAAAGVDGYILDLRSNPGGLLYAAVDIAQLWIQSGLILSVIHREGVTDEIEANGRALTDKPLVVLVDAGSANASEILAGALQGQQRAILVGAPTYGNNLIQSVRGLSDGSGLAVTVAKWYLPNGQDVSDTGLQPDIRVELTAAQWQTLVREKNIGTLSDPQFVAAVAALLP
ncbi:MAG: PDZ domain-containing protein [Leptolyngbyaceae cyanobacterium SM1_1_3]|nr:PDZ domain-containing protein [Leptolyngbyaceae cyanobacterium SM1_1_3]NJM85751.1 PDZ domain-containing protein [Leptolyngbyaceae cyanobacterium RM2_2_21]NJN02434.1 PDZ domain-containing protein [Leptolyngbyaceae cyanobacterium RM1_1_2]NJO10474.1 PDZ domain-containing protein [Leptolyngbyaceae cyanobacterium SL_1_1]